MKPPSTRQSEPSWRKASFCAGGECVEIAKEGDAIMLRNSTRPGRVVRYSPEEWKAFVKGLLAGEFDDLG
jgi:hypothetical protein